MKGHSCRSRGKQLIKFNNENIFNENLHHGLHPAMSFYDNTSDNYKEDR